MNHQPFDDYTKIHEYLDSIVKTQMSNIKDWMETYYQNRKKPIYGSVDIRNSGFKVAPVDTNLFPAGFNNLNGQARIKASNEFKKYFAEYKIKKALIVPEKFTRNYHYFENLIALKEIITSCSVEVKIGSPYIQEYIVFKASQDIEIFPLSRSQNNILIEDHWQPDAIILNTDLTSGNIEILENINQIIAPNPLNGWYRRRKFHHFSIYNTLIEKFSQDFNLDPWLLSTYITKCSSIDFRNKIGLEDLATNVEQLLGKVQEKYNQYSIKESPYVFIKSDNGTFGMGIMIAMSGEDILNINKKTRHSMHAIKGGVQNRELILQEGIPTMHHTNSVPYENIAYLINGNIVSFIKRHNPSRNQLTNLNTPQAVFSCEDKFTYNCEALVAEFALLVSAYEE